MHDPGGQDTGRSPAAVADLLAHGRLREALALAAAGSRAHPDDPAWLHVLGAAQHANGASDDAVSTLDAAAMRAPGDAVVRNTLGAVLIERGRFEEGAQRLREALRLRADYPEARFNLAIAERRSGHLDVAAQLLEELLSAHSGFAPAELELATLRVERGRPAEALPILERLLQRFPGEARLLVNMAATCLRLGDTGRASAFCDQALAIRDVAPLDLAALAHTLASLGRAEEASRVASRAVSQAPNSVDVRVMAADALACAGEARAAREHLAWVGARRPLDAAVLEKRAWASLAAGEAAEAVEAFAALASLEPRSRNTQYKLAMALAEAQRTQEARDVLERMLEANLRDAEVLAALVGLKGRGCDWHGLDALVAELREMARMPSAHPAPPQTAITLPGVDAREQRTWAENWSRARYPAAPARRRREPRMHDRLRIGYLSADFHAHATAHLIAPLLERHDRKRFEVLAYSAGRSDDSPLRRRIVAAVERVVEVRGLPGEIAARRIAADELDILIDLGGHATGSRLDVLAHRPAPVQIHFLGYPGTTGADFVDFLIADAVVIPSDHAAAYTETVLRMPGCYQPSDRVRAAGEAPARSALGLPEGATVFCSFNQAFKLQPDIFEDWCRLLNALPGSCLWLLDPGEEARARLRAFAAARRVDPVRLVFAASVPLEEHLARARSADVALDPFPCGSHTTASDMLWAGVPLVARRGDTFASRVSTSVLAAAGCAQWSFDDSAGAFDLALALGRDARLRAEARARLEAARRDAPLYDADAFARAFEALLEDAVRRVQ